MRKHGVTLIILITSFISGCGVEGEDNPFYPETPGEFCDTRGGVQLIEGGYIYCNNGEYIHEDDIG